MDWVLRSSALVVTLDRAKSIQFDPLLLQKGEVVLLKGNSGSGKSTLIHALAGLIPLQSGKIEIDAMGAYQAGQSPPRNWRRNAVSVMPQRAFFWNALSLKGNLDLAAWCKRVPRDYEPLQALGLAEKSAQSAHSLSLGEQQRLGALRALLGTAPVVLADEPTASLDDFNAEKLVKLMKSHLGNRSLIVSSHDSRLNSLVDRTIILPG